MIMLTIIAFVEIKYYCFYITYITSDDNRNKH